jgi:hypothetical protein
MKNIFLLQFRLLTDWRIVRPRQLRKKLKIIYLQLKMNRHSWSQYLISSADKQDQNNWVTFWSPNFWPTSIMWSRILVILWHNQMLEWFRYGLKQIQSGWVVHKNASLRVNRSSICAKGPGRILSSFSIKKSTES